MLSFVDPTVRSWACNMDEKAQVVSRYHDVWPQTFDPWPQPAGLAHRTSATVHSKLATFEETIINAPMLPNEAQSVTCQQQVEHSAGMGASVQTQKVRQSNTESPFLSVCVHCT